MAKYRIIKRGTSEHDATQFGKPFRLALPRRADVSLWELDTDTQLEGDDLSRLTPTRCLENGEWECGIDGARWRKIAVSSPDR